MHYINLQFTKKIDKILGDSFIWKKKYYSMVIWINLKDGWKYYKKS